MINARTQDKLGFIFGRRSIRVYSPGEITQVLVAQILEAAMAAPSAMTKDPWRFVVVRNHEALANMSKALPGGKMLASAGMAIIVCGDLERALDQQLSFLLQDCAAATQNILLAAHALGLGACWVGVHPSEDSVRRLKEIFSMPDNIVPVAAVSLGLPGEAPEPRTRYRADYVRFERW